MRKGGKTVLLCDAAFSALPILFALKRSGYRVAVCGSRPDDPGHALADASFVLDYGDREAVLRAVTQSDIAFLVPGCTDVSYLSCAWVASQLGLPGYDSLDATETIHRKDRFRELCRNQGFATPRSAASAAEASALRFPILVKPSDSFSGKGIMQVDRPADLGDAIEFSRSITGTQSVVFEEFIEGKLYSHSAFLQEGRIAVDFFVNEYCTVHPYQVNSSHVSVQLDRRIVNGLRQWLETFASILNLADGLMHTQFISDGETFHLIEVMRRCPGDLYALLAMKSTGAPYPYLYASPFCGVRIDRDEPGLKRFFSRHTLSVPQECVFFSSRIKLPNASVSFVPLKRVGHPLRAVPMDRAGIFFIEHATVEEMIEITPKLKDFIEAETPDDV